MVAHPHVADQIESASDCRAVLGAQRRDVRVFAVDAERITKTVRPIGNELIQGLLVERQFPDLPEIEG